MKNNTQQNGEKSQITTGEPAALKSRAQLKDLFKNGAQPDQGDFADLIDAFVHQDEIPELFDPRQPEQPPIQPQPHAYDGWQGAGGRIGLYDVQRGPEQMPRAQGLVRARVPADGRWHKIVFDLSDCYAFEIVASASGKVGSNNHAITHAIALISFEGYAGGIRQTASYRGWYWGRRIKLAWRRHGDHYDLCIRTGCSFGLDDEGNPVTIQFHVTRLW